MMSSLSRNVFSVPWELKKRVENGGSLETRMFRRITFSVASLAAATLLLESALLRLLAVAQFYHFAFLVVSLALLGFGASGSLLSLSTRLKTMPLDRLLTIAGIGFAVSVALAYLVVNLLPFDSYSIAWERRQILFFMLYYLALTMPFLFAGLGIGGSLAAIEGRGHLVYATNLLGSGIGALLAPLALWLVGVPGAVLSSGMIGLLGVLSLRQKRLRWGIGGFLTIGVLVLIAMTATNLSGRASLGMTISPYKGLAQAQRYPGSSITFSRWNAISRVDVIADAGTRQLPGLSYTFPGAPPPQHGLSLDGEALQPITLVTPKAFPASDFMPEAVAFTLRPEVPVLVLEPGGGLGVLQALASNAERVTAVVGNSLVPRAVASTAAEADPYHHLRVSVVIETPRVFIQRDRRDVYGIVFLPLTDGYRPVTSGTFSLSETYALTVEAFERVLAHLAEDSLLVVTRWLQVPPSESVRLIATLTEALERRGASPADSIVAYRGIQTLTVLVQPGGWREEELTRVRNFAEERRFDLVWTPDIQPEEVNRFNRLPEPAVYQAVKTLLTTADRASFFSEYPFDVTPPTDDHPFFFHFFTWRQIPEMLATLGRTWQPFGGSGYFVLLALLTLVLLLSGILILIPHFIRPKIELVGTPVPTSSIFGIFLYFTLLGIAFLFVEIPLIQRWILLIGHTTYAFAVVVMTLLLFSSLGSALARAPWLPKRGAMGVLTILALITPFFVIRLTDGTLGWPVLVRAAVAILGLAPLAVLMGLPFPLGLAWLEARAPHLVSWAWAINGCASVVAAILAAILALSNGFTVVFLLGAGAYAGAVVISVISEQ